MPKPPQVEVRRVYDELDVEATSGSWRVLVDRLWPRGVRKDELSLDEWAKDVAPSTELRRWYGHDPDRFDAFAERYRAELQELTAAEAVDELAARARQQHVVLLTATRDVERSAAVVLREVLNAQLRRRARRAERR